MFFMVSDIVFGMDHIKNTHVMNKSSQYIKKITNKDTGVVSAITVDSKRNRVQDRKTFFPEAMNDRSDFKGVLNSMINQQYSTFVHVQPGNMQRRRVEYKQDVLGKYMIAVVKDDKNSVSTAYPILRFISATQLNGKQDTDQIYLATQHDSVHNKSIDMTASVKVIKDASRYGVYLGQSVDKNNKISYLVDISQRFPSIFDGNVARGSITVQTDWIKPR